MAQLMRAKAPAEEKDYTWDWSNELSEGETIDTFTTSVISGDATVPSTAINGVYTIARVAGGTVDTTAMVTGTATTSTSKILVWTLEIPIRAI